MGQTKPVRIYGFNPCFSGISSGRTPRPGTDQGENQVSILVFLEFRPGALNLVSSMKLISSFNPCFSGISSGRIDGFFPTPKPLMFQSLFFWNFVRERWWPGGSDHISVVSILVFLEFRPGATFWKRCRKATWSFNPCFSGISSGRPTGVQTYQIIIEFQSLFFWNFVREQRGAIHCRDAVFCVSILVFLEFRPGDEMAFDQMNGNPAFQSLFFWNFVRECCT